MKGEQVCDHVWETMPNGEQICFECDNRMSTTLTLEDAARITGRPIKTQINGFQSIQWSTEKHDMTIQMVRLFGGQEFTLAVFGQPKPWTKGGEVRRGRPHGIAVYKVTERYLKTLR